MLLDVLSDRGFQASYGRDRVEVPVRFDSSSGRVELEERSLHRFSVRFGAAGVRDGQALKVCGRRILFLGGCGQGLVVCLSCG
jgi:hypothetical protein